MGKSLIHLYRGMTNSHRRGTVAFLMVLCCLCFGPNAAGAQDLPFVYQNLYAAGENLAEEMRNYNQNERCVKPRDLKAFEDRAKRLQAEVDNQSKRPDFKTAFVPGLKGAGPRFFDPTRYTPSNVMDMMMSDVLEQLIIMRRNVCVPKRSLLDNPSYWFGQKGGANPGGELATRGWVVGTGLELSVGQSWNHYGDVPSFDGDGWGVGGFAFARYQFGSGWFAGPEIGAIALRINGKNPDGAFSNIGTMFYEGGQLGYSFRTPATTAVNLYAGVAASQARFNVGFDTAGFFESMSKTLTGWTAHTGIEFQPAPSSIPNLWIGADYRYSTWCGNISDDRVSGGLHLFSVTASYQFSPKQW